jgi:hypothetical protein
LNSMPTTGGNLDVTYSAAQAISRFECITATPKLSPFWRTISLAFV